MNPEKIYKNFIENRRAKEDSIEGYFEVHHILPRSLGGTDNPDNLIKLTASDHIFAHYLLAKIHGGRQWAPIYLMVSRTADIRSDTDVRKLSGRARRLSAEAREKYAEGLRDKNLYSFSHDDGTILKNVTRNEASLLGEGLTEKSVGCLIRGKYNTFKGWRLLKYRGIDFEKERIKKYQKTVRARADKTLYSFRHFDGREELNITRQNFMNKHKEVDRTGITRLLNGRRDTHRGWFLAEKTASEIRPLSTARRLKISDPKTLYSFKNLDGREELEITYLDFLNKHEEMTMQTLGDIIFGASLSYKGWHLAENNYEEIREQIETQRAKNRRDSTLYSFVHEDGLIEENITRFDFMQKYEQTNPHGVSRLVLGSQKTHVGWSLAA